MIKHDRRVFYIDYGHSWKFQAKVRSTKGDRSFCIYQFGVMLLLEVNKEAPQNFTNKFLPIGNTALDVLRKKSNLFVMGQNRKKFESEEDNIDMGEEWNDQNPPIFSMLICLHILSLSKFMEKYIRKYLAVFKVVDLQDVIFCRGIFLYWL